MSDKLTEVQFDSQPMIAEIYSKNRFKWIKVSLIASQS